MALGRRRKDLRPGCISAPLSADGLSANKETGNKKEGERLLQQKKTAFPVSGPRFPPHTAHVARRKLREVGDCSTVSSASGGEQYPPKPVSWNRRPDGRTEGTDGPRSDVFSSERLSHSYFRRKIIRRYAVIIKRAVDHRRLVLRTMCG